MSVRMRAALVAAIVALGVAPAAEAAKTTSTAAKAKHGHAGKGWKHHPSEGAKTSRTLRKAITSQRMLKAPQALQVIADENGGNRASGFQGYGASIQYMLTKLRDAGYRPTTQVFDFVTFEELSDPVLREIAPTAKEYTQEEFATMNYSASGDTGAQTITPVDIKLDGDRAPAGNGGGSGCEAADFTGFPAGNIALIQRGVCDFAVKVVNAQTAGASGVIIFNQGNDPAAWAWSPARSVRPRRTASRCRPTSPSRWSASPSTRARAWPTRRTRRRARSSSTPRATAARRPTSSPTRRRATRTT